MVVKMFNQTTFICTSKYLQNIHTILHGQCKFQECIKMYTEYCNMGKWWNHFEAQCCVIWYTQVENYINALDGMLQCYKSIVNTNYLQITRTWSLFSKYTKWQMLGVYFSKQTHFWRFKKYMCKANRTQGGLNRKFKKLLPKGNIFQGKDNKKIGSKAKQI